MDPTDSFEPILEPVDGGVVLLCLDTPFWLYLVVHIEPLQCTRL